MTRSNHQVFHEPTEVTGFLLAQDEPEEEEVEQVESEVVEEEMPEAEAEAKEEEQQMQATLEDEVQELEEEKQEQPTDSPGARFADSSISLHLSHNFDAGNTSGFLLAEPTLKTSATLLTVQVGF